MGDRQAKAECEDHHPKLQRVKQAGADGEAQSLFCDTCDVEMPPGSLIMWCRSCNVIDCVKCHAACPVVSGVKQNPVDDLDTLTAEGLRSMAYAEGLSMHEVAQGIYEASRPTMGTQSDRFEVMRELIRRQRITKRGQLAKLRPYIQHVLFARPVVEFWTSSEKCTFRVVSKRTFRNKLPLRFFWHRPAWTGGGGDGGRGRVPTPGAGPPAFPLGRRS